MTVQQLEQIELLRRKIVGLLADVHGLLGNIPQHYENDNREIHYADMNTLRGYSSELINMQVSINFIIRNSNARKIPSPELPEASTEAAGL